MSPHSTASKPNLPAWQDQQLFDKLVIRSGNLRDSTRPNRSKMFDSLRDRFRRKTTSKVPGPSNGTDGRSGDGFTIETSDSALAQSQTIVGMEDTPPAYTADPSINSSSCLIPSSSSAHREEEDPFSFLSAFDTVLLIDDSASMAGASWRETERALDSLLPTILTHDADGVDVFFLNHVSRDSGDPKSGVAPGGFRNVNNTPEVESIFYRVTPRGGTPTGQRLQSIFRPYLTLLEEASKKGEIDKVKPLNIICITDGCPTDDVESVILRAAKKLDTLDAAPHQIGIQFFQVGNDPGATQALKELDDGLAELVEGGVRDMVDTCTWTGGRTKSLTGECILKVLLGAVVKRLDRKRLSG